MKWITPPENQGQIVEYSFCMVNGTVYQERIDHSTCKVRYWRSKALADDDGDYWNGAPKNKRWREIQGLDLPED